MEKLPLPAKMKVKIEKAEMSGFELSEYAKTLPEIHPYDKYEFTNTISYNVNRVEKRMTTSVNVKILNIDSKELLGSVNTSFTFFIENFDELVIEDKEKKQITFVDALFLMAASASISTTRGMLIMAAADTKIANAYFPIFDPERFIPKSA